MLPIFFAEAEQKKLASGNGIPEGGLILKGAAVKVTQKTVKPLKNQLGYSLGASIGVHGIALVLWGVTGAVIQPSVAMPQPIRMELQLVSEIHVKGATSPHEPDPLQMQKKRLEESRPTEIERKIEPKQKELSPIIIKPIQPKSVQPKVVKKVEPSETVQNAIPEESRQEEGLSKSGAPMEPQSEPAQRGTLKGNPENKGRELAPIGGKGGGIHSTGLDGAARYVQYPVLAFRRGQEGRVLLLIDVDEHGQVTQGSVIESSGFELLDQAAIKAAYTWKFKPATVNGVPESGKAKVPVIFKLPE